MTEAESMEILLVEDTEDGAELALHALRKSKLATNIQRVRDGEEALSSLFCRGVYLNRNFSNAPQLVLLDLKLPKIDGMEVLRRIKSDARTRSIPVIILTSSKEERDLADGYHSGVNSYIQKPVNFSDFQDVVRQSGRYWLLANSKPSAAAFSKQ